MSVDKAVHTFADEAINSNTAPERLAYLSQYTALKPRPFLLSTACS